MKHLTMLVSVLALLTIPAFAHVTANPNQGKAGTYFQTSLRISHGCEQSDTKVIRVKIPAGILTVHPQFKPGWEVELVKHKLDKPAAIGHGKTTDEVVDEVIWRGGPLPYDQYDDFGLIMKLPEKVGQVLWFPTTQECKSGENRWVDIPKSVKEWHHADKPAPYVTLTK